MLGGLAEPDAGVDEDVGIADARGASLVDGPPEVVEDLGDEIRVDGSARLCISTIGTPRSAATFASEGSSETPQSR